MASYMHYSLNSFKGFWGLYSGLLEGLLRGY